MKLNMAIAAVLFAALGNVAVAQQPAGQAPASMSGRVLEVDQKSQKIVIQTNDGQRREFRMSPDELAKVKVGDTIQATRVDQQQQEP